MEKSNTRGLSVARRELYSKHGVAKYKGFCRVVVLGASYAIAKRLSLIRTIALSVRCVYLCLALLVFFDRFAYENRAGNKYMYMDMRSFVE